MAAKAKALLTEALKLPRKSRVTLVEGLLESLQANAAIEAIEVGVEEAERRWQAYKKGEMRGIPLEEFASTWRKKSETT